MLEWWAGGVRCSRNWNERHVGWRECSVGVNMVFYFAGRDMAALVDILLGSMVFSLVYWTMGPLQVSSLTLLEASFAFLYWM